jgi:enamine deaminase RidA (YjgF/YER057c/UK114 family)
VSDEPEAPSLVDVPNWAPAVGYANGVVAEGRILAVAGQVGWDPATCAFASDDLVEQTRQALRNLAAVVEAAGGGVEHVVRLTWYVVDRDAYARARRDIGAVYRDIFGRHFPAMTLVVVAGLLEPRAQVEIEATAVLPPRV